MIAIVYMDTLNLMKQFRNPFSSFESVLTSLCSVLHKISEADYHCLLPTVQRLRLAPSYLAGSVAKGELKQESLGF